MKLPVRQEGLPIQPARSLNTHLMSMQEEKEAQSTIFEEIKEYLSVRSRIFSLQVAETTANLISNLISNAAALLFFVIFFVFASVGLALLVAQWVGNTAGGFFIVAGFYLLIGIVIWMIRSEEHTSELQSLMRISYAVLCLKTHNKP